MARSEPMVYDFSWPDRQFEGKPALDHVKDMGFRAVLTMVVVSGPIRFRWAMSGLPSRSNATCRLFTTVVLRFTAT